MICSSPDGTCILASDFDRKFSVYVIDADILEADQSPRTLAPYASFCSTDPIWAFAASPSFSLNDARTTHVLTSSRDQYISLHNVIWDVTGRSYNPSGAQTGPLDISYKLASYKLIDHLTEAVEAPLSLAYTTDGDAFAAGTKNQIAIFDVNYTDDPVLKIRTIPSARSKLKDGGVGFKGMASALSISRSRRVLAAGTRTRHVGLYDHEGSGEQITQFSLPGTRNRNRMATEELLEMEGLIGNGITQLKWSPCGKYLYIAERDNDALWIYDVRNFSYALGTCGGRNARGNMKMGFDVWFDPANDRGGHQIWAGDVDGHVQIWNDPHLREGTVGPDDVRVVGKGPVSNTLVHPTGSLVIAASGSVEAGEAGELKGKGNVRGGIDRPLVRDGGSLDIFGLTG
jgi:WD40 repeat protein